MYQHVIKNAKDGDIILFHDYVTGEYNTPSALKRIIPSLLEQGYEFVTVSELFDFKKMQNEEAYFNRYRSVNSITPMN
jgi:peptidoglycan/xylan/chitin deacetylase (PgdA/CDA1 family)